MIAVLICIAFVWMCFPLGALLAFTTFYGYNAPCETTIYLGPGVRLGVELGPRNFYWCPVGLVGVRVEML